MEFASKPTAETLVSKGWSCDTLRAGLSEVLNDASIELPDDLEQLEDMQGFMGFQVAFWVPSSFVQEMERALRELEGLGDAPVNADAVDALAAATELNWRGPKPIEVPSKTQDRQK